MTSRKHARAIKREAPVRRASAKQTTFGGLMSAKNRARLLVCLGLIALNIAVYAPVRNQEFLNYDDPDYVTENAEVRDGLTVHGFAWAFTTHHAGNWHPLTWVSHMTDVELYGVRPGPHKVTNVLLHIASTLVLFLTFQSITGSILPSGFVAALFAAHPMHVQSVAWIAERKDVLSALFWMLTIWAYVSYAKDQTSKRFVRYGLVVFFFALGLMAKPMLVSLPLILLLLDFWPLRRTKQWGALICEKLPLLALSLASSVITIIAQRTAMAGLEQFPLSSRLANAAVSCVTYIAMMIWPSGLALVYPYHPVPPWKFAAALVALAIAGIVAVRLSAKYPYLIVGWGWFLLSLAPVIGVVQVGVQSMADRYTYIPFIGLFVIVVWGAHDMLLRWKSIPISAISVGGLGLVAVAALAAHQQVGFYKDSFTLWTRTLQVTTDNWNAHDNLGMVLAGAGRLEEAIREFRVGLKIKPDDAAAHANLGTALGNAGKTQEAISEFSVSLRLNPNDARVRQNMAVALDIVGNPKDAIHELDEALRIDPDDATIHFDLGLLFRKLGDPANAIRHFESALKLRPNFPDARRALDEMRQKGS